jgi:hypothetical protein
MNNLQELKKSIFSDGSISESDTKTLCEMLFADVGINKTKAEFIFEIKDSVSRKKIHKDLENLFVEVITSFLLEDEESPDEIDESEAKWLRAKIQYKGYADDIDKKLLDSRPSWLQINSIDDLKSSLGKVILIILIVSFFEYSLNIHYKSVSDLLFLGIGILLISASLFLTHVHGGHKQEGTHKEK